jgi:predicted RNase H-like HicB family nuclease
MSSQFTAIYEKGDKNYIGYCLEVPGANGQGETLEECRESLREAIKLILEDRVEDGLRGVPAEAIRESLVVYETA